ncbi:MAG: zinc ribbon domain-containing protein [Fimbriimonadaceae bacterium]|nr:zinc ribbon domain-containing protein [Fimbriimonadaceae bacterium]
MSKVQRCQCGAEVVAGATFCVQCGMPVVQKCPYPNCGKGPVPLRTGDVPTSLCPFCGQEFLYCSRSGRLHPTYIATSETPGCEGVVLMSSLRSWPMAGGSPRQEWSVEAAKPIAVTKPEMLQPMEKPPTGFGIGAIISVGGNWIYAHGAALRTYRPGSASRQCGLTEVLPTESWRLLAWRGKVYAVGARTVDIVDASAFLRERTMAGQFVAQTHSSEHWVGAQVEAGKTQLVFVTSSGETVATHPLVTPPDGFPRLAATDQAVFAAAGSRLSRVTVSESQPIAEIVGEILSISIVGEGIVSLVARDGMRLDVRDFDGGTIGEIDLGCATAYRHPVTMDGRIYVIDASKGALLECRVDPPRLERRIDLPAFTSVASFVGSWHRDVHLLTIAGFEGERGGRIMILDAATGRSCHLMSPSGECRIGLATVGDKIAVSKSASYENLLSVFDVGAYEEHA